MREVCKELIEENEFANAQQLYQRALPHFKNMSKKMRESLSEEQKKQKDEVMHTLCLNLSFCHMKRNNLSEAIKLGKEALTYSKNNAKAYYRLAQAQKLNGELDDAKENLVQAIKLAPSDKNLREEYKKLTDFKQTKE